MSLAAPHSPVFAVPGLLNSLRLEHLSIQALPYRLFHHPAASAFPRIQAFPRGLLWALWGAFAQVALQKSCRRGIPGLAELAIALEQRREILRYLRLAHPVFPRVTKESPVRPVLWAIRTASRWSAEILKVAAMVVSGLHRSRESRPLDSASRFRELSGSTAIRMRELALHRPRRPLVVPAPDRSQDLIQNQNQHQGRNRNQTPYQM